jgi:mRNA interferase RelE/StbE
MKEKMAPLLMSISMIYSLRFHPLALKEWKHLDQSLQQQFKSKLIDRLKNPHVSSAKLSHMTRCYKIKLRAAGYRLVYHVDDSVVYVTIISIGKRDKNKVYSDAPAN